MSEVLTMAEIERRYDGEWVLLADPEFGADDALLRAQIVDHDADIRRLESTSSSIKLKSSALLFIGEPPEDVVYIL